MNAAGHTERAERQPVHWTARIGERLGIARNFSATGMFIELSDPAVVGSTVEVAVAVESEGKRFRMLCSGEVVRTERADGRSGIGIRFSQPAKLVPASSSEETVDQGASWRRVRESAAGTR